MARSLNDHAKSPHSSQTKSQTKPADVYVSDPTLHKPDDLVKGWADSSREVPEVIEVT
jgi:hypothetical protein